MPGRTVQAGSTHRESNPIADLEKVSPAEMSEVMGREPGTSIDIPPIKVTMMPPDGVNAKLIKLMEFVGWVGKDAHHDQGWDYLSTAGLLAKIQPGLVKVELVAVPTYELLSTDTKELPTRRGEQKLNFFAVVRLRLEVVDPVDGSSQVFTTIGVGQGFGNKIILDAQTVALRYAWQTALQIPTGDDPEPNYGSDGNGGSQSQPRAKSQQSTPPEAHTTSSAPRSNKPAGASVAGLSPVPLEPIQQDKETMTETYELVPVVVTFDDRKRNDGSEYTISKVELWAGFYASTFSDDLGSLLDRANKAGAKCRIAIAKNKQYWNITNVHALEAPEGDEPPPPSDEHGPGLDQGDVPF